MVTLERIDDRYVSEDHAILKAAGVAAIYTPGTSIPHAAREIIGMISERRAAA